MYREIASQGSLFTSDFLTESIQDVSEWNAFSNADLDQFGEEICAYFDRSPFCEPLQTHLGTSMPSADVYIIKAF